MDTDMIINIMQSHEDKMEAFLKKNPLVLQQKMKEFIVTENCARKSNSAYKDSFCQCFDFAEQCAKDGLIESPDDLLSALVDIVKGTDAALVVFAFALGFGIQSLEKIDG